MAEVLGISYRMLDSYLKESSQVHLYPLLPKIIAYLPELNRNWLYFGEGLPNLDKIEAELEESTTDAPAQDIDLAEVVIRQSKTIEQLTETNRKLTEQLLKLSLKGE